jgi:hypothetical protein
VKGFETTIPPQVRRAIFDLRRELSQVEGGVAGPTGPQGPAGPAGTSGGAFTHTQMSNAVSWSITHNLGYRPAVTTFDNVGDEIVGRVAHSSVNALTVHFSVAVSGTAHLS